MRAIKYYICDKCGSQYGKPEIIVDEKKLEEIRKEHPEAKLTYLCDSCVAIIAAPRN